MNIQEALEECKRRFPIGTKYTSVIGSLDNIKANTIIRISSSNNVVAYTESGSNRILWESNTFAVITGFVETYYEIY